MHLAAGTSVGLTGVAAGYTIGIVGDAVRAGCRIGDRRSSNSYIGCSSIHAAVSGLRGNDFDSDFRRSAWTLWVGESISDKTAHTNTDQLDCWLDPELEVLNEPVSDLLFPLTYCD
jgi:hypothetical protein